jgi:hypothetical protein
MEYIDRVEGTGKNFYSKLGYKNFLPENQSILNL